MTDHNISSLLHETATSMKMSQPKKREYSAPLACAMTEAELTAKYLDKPLPKLSDEMRAILGVGIPELPK